MGGKDSILVHRPGSGLRGGRRRDGARGVHGAEGGDFRVGEGDARRVEHKLQLHVVQSLSTP